MQLDDDLWHRFFIDAGVVFWRTMTAPVFPPQDDVHRYLHRDLGAAFGVVGKMLKQVSCIDLPDGGEIRLEFNSDTTLVLRNVSDRSEVAVEQNEQRHNPAHR
jgi:hypothetical protein